MIRPQQQQEKKRREMIDALKKNDKVLTSAGIYGTVVSVDNEDDRVVVRVDDDRGVKIAFSKASDRPGARGRGREGEGGGGRSERPIADAGSTR